MRFLLNCLSVVALLQLGSAAYAAEPLAPTKGPVLLTLSGSIEQTNAPGVAQFDREALEVLGRTSLVTTSALSKTPQVYQGVSLQAVLGRVGAKGRTVKASALNAYEIEIPLEDLQYNPILATHVDGQALKVRDKGPLWIVYPRDAFKDLQDVRYDSRWVWQLNRLHVE